MDDRIRHTEAVAASGDLDVVGRRADGTRFAEVEIALGLEDSGAGGIDSDGIDPDDESAGRARCTPWRSCAARRRGTAV